MHQDPAKSFSLRFLPFLILADEPRQSAIAGCCTLQRRCQFVVAMAAPQPAAAARGQELPGFLRTNRPDPTGAWATRMPRRGDRPAPPHSPIRRPAPLRPLASSPSRRRRRRGGAGEDDGETRAGVRGMRNADAELDMRAYICALRSSFYQLVKIYQVIW